MRLILGQDGNYQNGEKKLREPDYGKTLQFRLLQCKCLPLLIKDGKVGFLPAFHSLSYSYVLPLKHYPQCASLGQPGLQGL